MLVFANIYKIVSDKEEKKNFKKVNKNNTGENENIHRPQTGNANNYRKHTQGQTTMSTDTDSGAPSGLPKSSG